MVVMKHLGPPRRVGVGLGGTTVWGTMADLTGNAPADRWASCL